MADNITQLTVVELKKDPSGNSEFVHATSDSMRWGAVKKVTLLAPHGTHMLGDLVQVTVHTNVETEEGDGDG